MNAREFKDVIRQCVNYACQSKQPIHSVFEFVRKLVYEKGWSEVHARTVGARSLAIVTKWEKGLSYDKLWRTSAAVAKSGVNGPTCSRQRSRVRSSATKKPYGISSMWLADIRDPSASDDSCFDRTLQDRL